MSEIAKANIDQTPDKKEERNVFFFLVVLLVPLLSIAAVGGYGFIIWMLQILFGAPTG